MLLVEVPMNRIATVQIMLLTIALACWGALGAVAATSPWSLYDTATIVKSGVKSSPWVVQMTSKVDPTQPYGVTGGEIYYTPSASLYFQDIYQLSTDWEAVTPWGGGSPRFSLAIDMDDDGLFNPSAGDGWAVVYILPQFPYFYGGATGWLHTGNLIGSAAGIYDTTQFGGPSGYTNYAGALSLLNGKRVLGVMMVTDGGWFTSSYYGVSQQVVWANNITVNSDVFSAAAPTRSKK